MNVIQKNLVSGSQNNSSIDRDEENSGSINQSMSEDNLNSSLTVSLETQIQMDKLKKQNQTLKLKLGDSEEENSRLSAQVEKLKLENKDLAEDLSIERKKSQKDTSSSGKVEQVVEKLEQAERELQTKTFEYESMSKQVKILEDKISELRANHKEDKEKIHEEMEELRSKCRKLEQVENLNNIYKRKLEESSDYKARIQELEDQNESLLSQFDGKKFFIPILMVFM
jgi:uncharacterized protein (DUF3084 family)